MEVKYVAAPEYCQKKQHYVVSNPQEIIKILYEHRSVSEAELREEDIRYETEVYDKGIVIFVCSNAYDYHDICGNARIIVSDDGIEYIVTGAYTIDPGPYHEYFQRVNEEALNEAIANLGNKRMELPDKIPFFKKKKLEKYRLETLTIYSTYFSELQDEEIKIIEQLESEEDKNRRRIEQLELLKKEIAELEKRIDEKISEFNKISNDEMSIEKTKVPFDLLFTPVDDHYEIRSEYLIANRLRRINLSPFTFKNVKVSGVDLSETDAAFDPQVVYQKDLSNGNFEGVNFDFKDFTGINITGATFGPGKRKTGTIGYTNFDKAINNEKKR